MAKVDPADFDDGIRDSVLALWKAGFQTFTCCEGGYRHSFRHPTIGVVLVGDYFRFRDKLAKFLHAQNQQTFDISLMTSYHPTYRKAQNLVFVEGLCLLSPEKHRQALSTIHRREAKLGRLLEQLTAP